MPLPGVTLAILDDEGQPLPQGQAGSIYVHQPAYADFSYIGNDAARRPRPSRRRAGWPCCATCWVSSPA